MLIASELMAFGAKSGEPRDVSSSLSSGMRKTETSVTMTAVRLVDPRKSVLYPIDIVSILYPPSTTEDVARASSDREWVLATKDAEKRHRATIFNPEHAVFTINFFFFIYICKQ